MSVFDDLEKFVGHLARGDLNGALGDAGTIVHHVVGGSGQSPDAGGVGAAQAASTNIQQAINAGATGRHTGTVVPPPPAGSGAAGSCCCDRFSFNGGFLVDGATGSVWQYNQKTKTFEEVPVLHSPVKQTLIDTLVETKLSQFRSQYECEVLSTVAPASRPKLLAAFEKEHLVPLRDAAKSLLY